MKKKVLIILSIVVVLVISSFAYVSLKTKKLEKQMVSYIDEKGYSTEELTKLDVSHSLFGAIKLEGGWSINVVYKDEPGVDYYYTIENGKVTMSGFSGDIKDKSALKHLDIEQ